MPRSAAQLRQDGIDPATLYYAERILAGHADMPADPDQELTKTINYLKEREVAQKDEGTKTNGKGRRKLDQAEAVGPQFVSATPADLAKKEHQMVVAHQAQEATVRAVAAQLGYQLPAEATDPDLIQRDIAANMRRSVEACLEVGRGLMVLKAACEHGQFGQRLDALGLDASVAQRFMQASAKFSNAATSQHLLKAIGTQSKLLEMLVLDDEQIDELALTGQTGELHLDDVATMSVKELRAALREAKETATAKDRLIADKNAKIDELAARKGRVKTEEPDDVLASLRHELAGFVTSAEHEIAGKVMPAIRAITDHHAIHGGESGDILEGAIRQIERMTQTVRLECGLGEF
jgi:hypothetical protein